MDEAALDDAQYREKLGELDHLLNDADVQIQPFRIWKLLAELTHHDRSAVPRPVLNEDFLQEIDQGFP